MISGKNWAGSKLNVLRKLNNEQLLVKPVLLQIPERGSTLIKQNP